MKDAIEALSLMIFISSVIQLIAIIVFFVTAHNISKIRKTIEKKLGDVEEEKESE